jgi:hypothetical protein
MRKDYTTAAGFLASKLIPPHTKLIALAVVIDGPGKKFIGDVAKYLGLPIDHVMVAVKHLRQAGIDIARQRDWIEVPEKGDVVDGLVASGAVPGARGARNVDAQTTEHRARPDLEREARVAAEYRKAVEQADFDKELRDAAIASAVRAEVEEKQPYRGSKRRAARR